MRKSPKKSSDLTQRQLRVGEEIRHILAKSLMMTDHHQEPLLKAGYITVTEVRVAPDLHFARVYIMPLGGRDQEPIVKALNRVASFYRGELGRHLPTKFTPKLRFYLDPSFDQADRILSLLRANPLQDPLSSD